MPLGLPQHRVEIHPYDPNWPLLFAQEAQRLQTSLGDWALDIQHIGSTSVPGMPSKPIIDIAIAVQDFEQAFDTVPLMAELGYNFRGEVGVKRRHFFMLGRPRTHHIHMLEQNSQAWKYRVGFRDFLVANPESAREYMELKQRLAAEFPRDIASYSNGKESFIDSILARI
ncbi:MAG TPA: GrpB family protein [Fimbriimonas sp.]|nr:GrpB family protein [Fimbriimonas sp.]